MALIKLLGYFDSPSIATGFLVPVYVSLDGQHFTHILSADLKKIERFAEFSVQQYQHDQKNLKTDLDPDLNKDVKEGDSSFFVFKARNKIIAGFYRQFIEQIASLIADDEIKSSKYIDKLLRDFGENISSAIRKITADTLSDLDGVAIVKIKTYLQDKKGRSLVDMVHGRDSKFNAYVERIVLGKNRKVISVPPGMEMSSDGGVIQFTTKLNPQTKISIYGRVISTRTSVIEALTERSSKKTECWVVSAGPKRHTIVQVKDARKFASTFAMAKVQGKINEAIRK